FDHSGGSPTYGSVSGEMYVPVHGATPYGHGWTLADENYLAFNGSDIIIGRADGEYSDFKEGGGSYTPPPYDLGTLTAIGGGYVYTDSDQLQWIYNGSGQLVNVVDRNGETVTYSYDGGLLASVLDPNNNEAQFGYSSGKLAN